mmetsp:Transcript_61549/g.190631  ORF Transcript_61549/g.190631 Transcript_61549/m.190631 type:complete len:240 (-) Transcript_61549:897-1616(-)
MLHVLKMLKPLPAVVTHTLGNCGCHRSSLSSRWPWCMKSSCGGKCSAPGGPSRPTASSSTAMSHSETESSSHATARTVSSVGCQSTETIGFLCQRKLAMGPAAVFRVSQILKPPSSAPLTRSSATQGLQLMAFTSLPWASLMATAALLRFFSRTSQTRTLWSELQEAKIVLPLLASLFQCKSSTDEACPAKGPPAPTFQPPATGSQRSMEPSLPPVTKWPVLCGLKSIAKPSCECASHV